MHWLSVKDARDVYGMHTNTVVSSALSNMNLKDNGQVNGRRQGVNTAWAERHNTGRHSLPQPAVDYFEIKGLSSSSARQTCSFKTKFRRHFWFWQKKIGKKLRINQVSGEVPTHPWVTSRVWVGAGLGLREGWVDMSSETSLYWTEIDSTHVLTLAIRSGFCVIWSIICCMYGDCIMFCINCGLPNICCARLCIPGDWKTPLAEGGAWLLQRKETICQSSQMFYRFLYHVPMLTQWSPASWPPHYCSFLVITAILLVTSGQTLRSFSYLNNLYICPDGGRKGDAVLIMTPPLQPHPPPPPPSLPPQSSSPSPTLWTSSQFQCHPQHCHDHHWTIVTSTQSYHQNWPNMFTIAHCYFAVKRLNFSSYSNSVDTTVTVHIHSNTVSDCFQCDCSEKIVFAMNNLAKNGFYTNLGAEGVVELSVFVVEFAGCVVAGCVVAVCVVADCVVAVCVVADCLVAGCVVASGVVLGAGGLAAFCPGGAQGLGRGDVFSVPLCGFASEKTRIRAN